ncbi:MAG: hypothetical protein K0S61_1123 [Anaerocolumna sp.]|jgi:hypothetical protein|nr:hypothetical protein [Anaerocolumna sp.]
MRRNLYFTILLSILLIVTVGCTNTAKASITTETPKVTETPVVTEIPKGTETPNVTYTDEFDYLPKHPSMKLKDFIKGEQGNFDYAFYTISGVEFNSFFTKYEAILKQDNWTVSKDEKPNALTVEKGNHLSAMALSKENDIITLVITAK